MALLAAAGLYLGGAGLAPAQAADLGGDCCADLEERVAELEATTARKGNRRVSLTISGQVTTAIMAWDDGSAGVGNLTNDGDNSDIYVVDTAFNGGSGFTLSGSARINPNVTAGFEIAIGLNVGARSHQVNQADDDGSVGKAADGDVVSGAGDTRIVMTRANWYLGHKGLGTVRVGRINTATAGVSTVDLGGAGVVANASIGYWQRGFFLSLDGEQQTGTWSSALGGATVNGASLSRANAVSYTSPTFGGFSVAAAWGEDDIWDVAARYAGEFGGFRIAGAIGYISNSTGTNEVNPDHEDGAEPSQIKGSASILHVASGLYLSGSYVNQDNDTAGRPDTTLWYVQGGISKNWTGLGKTVLYGEYANVEDGIICGVGTCQAFGGNANDVVDSSEANMWGLGIVQHIDAAAMEVYLSYRMYSAELTSPVGNDLADEDFDDFSVVMGGARIRF